MATSATPRAARVSTFAVASLFLLALAGRYSFGWFGVGGEPWDVRIPGCLALILIALLAYSAWWTAGYRHTWPTSTRLICALFALQALSALWAAPDARLGSALGDLAALVVLVVSATVISAPDPDRAALGLLAMMLAAAVLFAVGGLVAGGQVQGRVSAFGGGPNVFVRVMCMGMIAAVFLALLTHRWWPLLPIPLLAVAALLSGSRGGLIALVVTTAVFLVPVTRRARRSRPVLLVASAVVVGYATWSALTQNLDSPLWERYSLDTLRDANYSYRPRLWSSAWSLFIEHPYVGAGLDAFYSYVGYSMNLGYAHNYVLSIAADLGMVGLAFLVVVAVCWWRDVRPWRELSTARLGCAMMVVYIACASMVSGDYYDSRFAWILAVIVVNHRATQMTAAPIPALSTLRGERSI